MVRILVIGGSGATGTLVISEALQRGHAVTALVRDPSALPAQPGLKVVQGTPLALSDIETAFKILPDDLPAAIIVTLASPKIPGTRIMADSHEHLITAMNKYNISKIVTLSSFGTGSSLQNINSVMRWAIGNTSLQYSYGDHNLVDQKLKSSNLDFVLPRPARLTLGDKSPMVFYGDDGAGMGAFAGLGGISRASVAGFLIDAVESDEWNRSTPVISN
jgi:putative NADH-flavin reductase